MMTPLSVSGLNEQIKNLLESTFVRVYVEGELSRITYHNSGHVYFTLKDAGSSISCVMFRGNASRLKFRLEEGLKVLMEGAISVYKPRGQYQINAFSIEPSGHGALALAYEQLKNKLEAQGYFDITRKMPIPKVPKRIGLVTSATGAAFQDMQRVAAHRWPLVELVLFDSIVQGDAAAPSIVRALQAAEREGLDIIVIGRGGGSMEDLWAFNEEMVADAIHAAQTPVVSAVGHEIDWVISDHVADLRAPTPSAAMQMILPDQNELLQYIDGQMQQFDRGVRQVVHRCGESLGHLRENYQRHSVEQRLKNSHEMVEQLRRRFDQQIDFRMNALLRELQPLHSDLHRYTASALSSKTATLHSLVTTFESNDPKRKSKKGFAQIVKHGKVTELGALKAGEQFEAVDASVKVVSTVESVEPLSPSKT
jgi:exodeoxyribonuclease VII large subunit